LFLFRALFDFNRQLYLNINQYFIKFKIISFIKNEKIQRIEVIKIKFIVFSLLVTSALLSGCGYKGDPKFDSTTQEKELKS
jgi:hypothetical protein